MRRIVLALFVGLAGCVPPREDGRLASAVASEVGSTLKQHAFASGIDFTRWEEQLSAHADSLERAHSDEEIATVLNHALSSFGCSHLSILTPLEAEERSAGIRTGPGMTTQAIDGGLLVCAVVEDGPAAEAGLLRGDLVTEVDGGPPTGESLRGAPGDRRALRWRSRGLEVTGALVLREHRRASPDRITFLDDGTALIAIHSFSTNLYDRARIKRLFDEAQPAPRLILDLRSNKGGNAANVEHLLTQIVAITKGVCVDIYREDADETRRLHPERAPTPAEIVTCVAPDGRSVTAPADDSIYAGPLAVLVDSQCGSGGELAPYSLQRLGRAVIVGSPTPGKVRIGDNHTLVGGFELQTPIGEYVASDGSIIEGVGVEPDVLLSFTETASDPVVIAAALRALSRGPD